MTLRQFDTIIIGQGLAGTTLAWTLLKHGQRVLVIDQEDDVTSSKIAAGLITPITGMRLVISWRFNLLHQFAVSFYQRIEKQTASVFYYQRGMMRLFSSEAEQERFKKKRNDQTFRDLVKSPISDFHDQQFASAFGGFEMPQAAQLNTATYLNQSRWVFQNNEGYLCETVDSANEIELQYQAVRIPKLQVQADRLIFCQGAADRNNTWFPQLQFKPAKGEILTLKIPNYHEQRIINHKGWLAPMADDCYAAGSTYQWDQLNCVPTDQGKEEIASRLKQFLRCDFHITNHRAAIRPALHDQKPIIGMHLEFPQIGIMNGLGSKGSLQAPWIAENFANHLCHGDSIDTEIDLNRRFPA
ncbi:MAG: FAD-dependent oxidoreductase [Planctomycetaceae bacterium]|nr:FAD-dependent oxidoreductase [Planctomycetaceae bacterium]